MDNNHSSDNRKLGRRREGFSQRKKGEWANKVDEPVFQISIRYMCRQESAHIILMDVFISTQPLSRYPVQWRRFLRRTVKPYSTLPASTGMIKIMIMDIIMSVMNTLLQEIAAVHIPCSLSPDKKKYLRLRILCFRSTVFSLC